MIEAGNDAWVNRYSNGVQKLRVLLIGGGEVVVQIEEGFRTFEITDVFETKRGAQLALLKWLRKAASTERRQLFEREEKLEQLEQQITDILREMITGISKAEQSQ